MPPTIDAPTRPPAFRIAAAVAAVVVAAQYLAVADLPLFSETYTHWAATSRFGSAWRCFDPSLDPLRPLQHLYFWVASHTETTDGALLRAPAFVAHWLSSLAVFGIARALGARPLTAGLSAVAFVAFPNAKALYWVAAIGWPGRVLFSLAAVLAFLHHRRRPHPLRGAALVACFVLALACNQGAVVLPGVLLLLSLAVSGPRGSLGALRDPWILGLVAVASAYLVHLLAARAGTVHQGGLPAGALLANTARAAFSLAPEGLRGPALQGLRAGGADGSAVAALAWLPVGVPALWALARGPAIVRALLVCAALDLLPSVLVTGFVQRYAYLASAFPVLALGLQMDSTRGRPAARWIRPATALLVAAWAWDTARDLREIRAAGRIVADVVAASASVRAEVGPAALVTIADAPTFWGSERDLPVFNWGLREALVLRGDADGPYDLVRTHGYPWPDGNRRLTPDELARLVEARDGPVLVFEPERKRLRRVR